MSFLQETGDIAWRFYPDRLLRPITAISILVSEEEFQNTLKVLAKSGFRRKANMGGGLARASLSREGRGNITVEIRSRLFPDDNLESVAHILNQSFGESIPGLAHDISALSIEQSLAFLVFASVHQRFMQSPVCLNDLHFLIENSGFAFARERNLDWDLVIEIFHRRKLLSAAWFVFSLLGGDWGTQVPEDVMRDFGRSLSLFRKRVLSHYASSKYLFTLDGQLLPWFVRSRFFFQDSVLNRVRAVEHDLSS